MDSFLDHNLSPLYRELVSDHGFSLDIKCYPADMIYSLVSSKQADVGFALYHTSCPHVDVVPIMEDEMVLVLPHRKDASQEAVHPSSLPPEKELLTGSRLNIHCPQGCLME